MSWEQIDFSEVRSGSRHKAEPLEKRLRFHIDETIGPDVADKLRRAGANIVLGRPGLTTDEVHAQEALRQRRLIVTNDRDFLNDRKSPRCGSVVSW